MKRNGTVTAHGKTWPMYESTAYQIEVAGRIDAETLKEAETLKAELDATLGRYDVEVKLEQLLVIAMLPEDQAEKEALDEAAIKRAA